MKNPVNFFLTKLIKLEEKEEYLASSYRARTGRRQSVIEFSRRIGQAVLGRKSPAPANSCDNPAAADGNAAAAGETLLLQPVYSPAPKKSPG